jgi:chromosome segregation ATPase
MILLNILEHGDTTFAWDNLLILLLAAIAGYLLSRFSSKKADNRKWLRAIQESENKHKRIENEFKNFKSNISATEKHNDKAVVELNNRVKGLEGDIRALSEEKNKLFHGMEEKDLEIKRLSRLVNEGDERFKQIQEAKLKADTNWEGKLKASGEELSKAMVWQQKVRAAEEDAQRARAAINFAERKKLEAELRLKATTEYAGKVIPLENELKTLKEKYGLLDNQPALNKDAMSGGDVAKAQLELLKQNNVVLQQELETKHAAQVSLLAELELLKTDLKKLFEEKEQQSPETSFKGLGQTAVAEQFH